MDYRTFLNILSGAVGASQDSDLATQIRNKLLGNPNSGTANNVQIPLQPPADSSQSAAGLPLVVDTTKQESKENSKKKDSVPTQTDNTTSQPQQPPDQSVQQQPTSSAQPTAPSQPAQQQPATATAANARANSPQVITSIANASSPPPVSDMLKFFSSSSQPPPPQGAPSQPTEIESPSDVSALMKQAHESITNDPNVISSMRFENGGVGTVNLPQLNMESITSEDQLVDYFRKQIAPEIANQYAYESYRLRRTKPGRENESELQGLLNTAWQRYYAQWKSTDLEKKVVAAQNGQYQLSPEELQQAYALNLIIPTYDGKGSLTGFALAPGASISKQGSQSAELDRSKTFFDPQLTFVVQRNTAKEIRDFNEYQTEMADDDAYALRRWSPYERMPYLATRELPVVMPSIRTSSQGSVAFHAPQPMVPAGPGASRGSSGGGGGKTRTLPTPPLDVNPVYGDASITMSSAIDPAGYATGQSGRNNPGLNQLPALANATSSAHAGVKRLAALTVLADPNKILSNGYVEGEIFGQEKLKGLMPGLRDPGNVKYTALNNNDFQAALSSMVTEFPALLKSSSNTGQRNAYSALAELIASTLPQGNSSKGDALATIQTALQGAGGNIEALTKQNPQLLSMLAQLSEEGMKGYAALLAQDGSQLNQQVELGGGKYTRKQLGLMFAALSQFMTPQQQAGILAALQYGKDRKKYGSVPDFSSGLTNAQSQFKGNPPWWNAFTTGVREVFHGVSGQTGNANLAFQQASRDNRLKAAMWADATVGFLSSAILKGIRWN